MLSFLRRNAASWIVKIILGLLILVFIFFFGAGTLHQSTKGSRDVAKVGKKTISERRLNGTFKMLQDSNPAYKNLPENFIQQLKLNAQQNLIQQQILIQSAQNIGLRATKKEVVNQIKESSPLFKDGKFDMQNYKTRFRPGFANRYGIDYEEWVADTVVVNKLDDLFAQIMQPANSETESYFNLNENQISVERIALNPTNLQNTIKVSDEQINQHWQKNQTPPAQTEITTVEKNKIKLQIQQQQVLAKAAQLSKSLSKQFTSGNISEKQIKQHNLDKKELEDVSILEASDLFIKPNHIQYANQVFKLSKDNPKVTFTTSDGFTYFFKYKSSQQVKTNDWQAKKDQEQQNLNNILTNQTMEEWLNLHKTLIPTSIN